MNKGRLWISISTLLMLVSCIKPNSVPEADNGEMKGLLVLNEGTYTAANSTMTFYDLEADTSMNAMFYRVNDAPIGDVGQSLTICGDDLFVVVNNSNYIYKLKSSTLKYQDKIDGFYSPRQMLFISDDKAYVSDLLGTGVWVVNPETLQHVSFIETEKPTEAMLKYGDEVFVSNWSNYYQPMVENNTIQVINCKNDCLESQIQVSKEPNSMVLDSKNRLWVLCGGGYTGVTEPSLYCIDAESKAILKKFDFSSGSPSNLAIDKAGETMYFINGNLYAMSVEAEALPSEAFVEAGSRILYNVAICPESGDVFVTDVKNYIQNGEVLRYSADGQLKSSFTAGIIPSAMIFN